MLAEYRYTYLFLSCLFLIGWLFLYIQRKDERAELLSLSLLLALFGVVGDMLYVKDWWNPVTVLGRAPFSGESIIASFGIVGVGSVLPEYILKLKTTSPGKIFTRRESLVFIFFIFTAIAIFFGSFYLFNVNSLISTVAALVFPTLFMWWRRKDLILVSIANGFFLLIFSMLVYSILNQITPGWIDAFYYFKNTPHIVLAGLPIDDAFFYFFTGIFLGTFYEWWQGVWRIPVW